MKFVWMSFLVCLFLLSCSDSEQNHDNELYSEKEINNRIELIDKTTFFKDSLPINTSEIINEIDRIILLSKDVENLQASVNMAGTYFSTISLKYGISTYHFKPIHVGMSTNEIFVVIKQNELNLLNQLIFKSNPNGFLLESAQ